jgi:hypothetical protein
LKNIEKDERGMEQLQDFACTLKGL